MRRRQITPVLAVMLAVSALVLLLFSSLPAGAASPDVSTSPSPAASPGTSATPSSPAPSPGASPAASLPPGGSSAVPQPACPLQMPLPTIPPGEPNAGQPVPQALCPAQLSGDPVALMAWLFNPIFQTLFLLLTGFYQLAGDIGIAIIVLTILIKTLLIPISRAQIVSQRRMQMLQPEIRALQLKFKGNRAKVSEETMKLYKERGVNPASGCLPAFLQLGLLIPIYSVINSGLAAPDISSALQFLGQPVLNGLACQAPTTLQPCIDPTVAWLGNLDAHLPQVTFRLPVVDFPVSVLAIIAAFLQLVQTRMMTPSTNDPQTAAQQRIFLVLPLFSIIYGAILPAGLFLYWIVFTAYSIVQQYLIVGWGSLFPLFGWTPGFAANHEPRFPVSIEPLNRPESGTSRTSTEPSRSPTDSAAGTIRPARQRARTSRRGRRR